MLLSEYFTLALLDSDPEKSRNGIVLLGMCGLSEVSVISAISQVIQGEIRGFRSESGDRGAPTWTSGWRGSPARLSSDC